VGKPDYKYMATCDVIREFYPFLNKKRVCDKFVEKTCEGCKHEDKRQYGTCHASDVNPIANEKAGNPFYKCGVMDNQPELGRYAWESAEEAKEEPIPEKNPEKKIEWKYVSKCADCEKWVEHGSKCKAGRIIRCNDMYPWPGDPKTICFRYKKKKPEKEPEKKWSWQADCGDCIHLNGKHVNEHGNLICGYDGPYYIKGGFVIATSSTTRFHRRATPDFHDCEGYTAPEPEKPNPVELKCDTCIHYPVQSDPKRVILCGEVCGADHEAYIPRSCENCGRGGWNNLCDFPLHEAIKCRNKTWRSWTPRKEPEKKEITLPDGSERCEWDLVNNTLSYWFTCHTCGKYTNRKYPLTTTAVVIGLSCKECEDNEEVIKENKKENEEVTEMNKYDEETRGKIKELFPFTCPECGAGVYQRENYCMHCGHAFNGEYYKPGDERVKEKRKTVMDRFRAWRQAREDKKRDERANRLQETIYQRDARIAELEDTKKELNLTIIDKNALISILEEQVKEWQDKYNKTFSSGVKKVEECKEHYEAKITAITTDRDENWIPKSNRLTFKPISASFSREEDTNQPIYINAMGLSPILKNLVNIEAEINGDTAKAIMDGNFVAFSTYVLKDVLKDGEE
jgi:ribosomal protein L33